jgi:hypothetical protein
MLKFSSCPYHALKFLLNLGTGMMPVILTVSFYVHRVMQNLTQDKAKRESIQPSTTVPKTGSKRLRCSLQKTKLSQWLLHKV